MAEPPPSVIVGERRRTHAQIADRGGRAAGGFAASGIGEGDAVALLLRNDFAFFEGSLGATWAGAYPVPINWRAGAEEAAYILRDCGAKALVAHNDFLAALGPALPPGLLVLSVATPPEIAPAASAPGVDDTERWDSWVARQPAFARPATAVRPAVIYTSGTTGRPKGVRRSAAPQATPSARALAVYGLDDPARVTMLMTGSMSHSVPNACGRLALQTGAEIVFQTQFEPEEMLSLIARHRVTHMHIVPAMFVRLLRLPEAVRTHYDLSSLRHVVHGAAPCPPAIKAAMIAWWGPVIHEYYGSTETGLLTFHDSAEALRKPGTVGRALPGIMLTVRDAQGSPVPTGRPGDVHAGSDTLHAFDYIGLAERRAEVARGTLVKTGDIGRLDADGYLFLMDRARDVIVTGGTPLYPSEIEAALLHLPGVKDCAVFGIPDAELGEVPCAHVEPVSGHTLYVEDIRARLGLALGPLGAPRRVVIASALPREDSGKIFKNRLRAPYWETPGD